ncbi:ABC transporter permease [Acuticoccus sp. MNP-M23]|uniref:ABC transporter permease n=1 Tax=Acuticoccus sp. MNP-M23 TaxID=3072793 RepID=UPI0028154D87|nr:ABC transporter permease [Acuticoccus sp. MNP-M23]WMS41205.1 ABC transporter permease [Acuticoccus sp. MNP-M23]
MDARVPAAMPTVDAERRGDGVRLSFAGAWTINTAEIAEHLPRDNQVGEAAAVSFDLAGVSEIDSAGAWLIHRLRARLEFAGRRVTLNNVDDQLAYLLKEIEARAGDPVLRPRRPYAVVRALASIGQSVVSAKQDMIAMLSMLGVFGLRLVTACTHFRHLRITSILANFDQTCRGAVPIVMLMSFLIGLIIAQQGGLYLRSFGADLFVVDLSGVLILREMGVILAAILVAGRSGSAFTAEIGSMRMQEEVDALHVIGLDPVEVLVVPRMMALIIALPLLTFLSDIAALTGAALISWAYLGITPDLFIQRLNEAVTPVEFYIGIAKAPFMALIIGLVACSEGLKVGGSAESLGRHTTSAVVKSIFLVIVVDGVFAVFFGAIGI